MGRTASSFYAPPTAREIVLLLTLLIFLLVTSSNLTGSVKSSQLHNYPSLQSPSTTHHKPTNASSVKGPKKVETVLSWKGSEKVPDTVIVAHVPGWTILDRMYALDGTLYIVTDDPASVPDRKFITSTALRVANGPIEGAKRIPTDKNLRIISTSDAKKLFGSGADVLDGVTVSLAILYLTTFPNSRDTEVVRKRPKPIVMFLSTPDETFTADPIDLVLLIIITGLPSSSSDSGGRTLHLTLLSRKTEIQPCLHPAGYCSHILTPTTGAITLK